MTLHLAVGLAEASLRSLVLAIGVGLVLRLRPFRTAIAESGAWTAVLAGMLLMPVLPMVVPGVAWPSHAPASATAVGAPEAAAPGAAATEVAPKRTSSVAPQVAPGGTAHAAPVTPPPSSLEPAFDPAPWLSAVWAAGALIGLLRLLHGWQARRRLLRGARSVPADPSLPRGHFEVLESESVRGPVALGVWRPRVLLPAGWRDWPADWRAAALAHEMEHLRRRDPLVRVLARLNACLYWFHPLAWWLESRLRGTAERACDAAGAAATAGPRRYAEILVELSRLAGRPRAAWVGAAMTGSRLEWRIDRVLEAEGRPLMDASRAWPAVVAGAALALAVAACRAPVPAPEPLRPDPTLVARQQLSQTGQRIWNEARDLDVDGVAALEARLVEEPGDLQARQTLLFHFLAQLFEREDRSATPAELEAVRAARRRHVAWLVAHRPGLPLAASIEVRLEPDDEPRFLGRPFQGERAFVDPTGFAEVRDLWLAHTEPPDAPVRVLQNAAWFFEQTDPLRSERLLERARRREPGPESAHRLGHLYAAAELSAFQRRMPVGLVTSFRPTPLLPGEPAERLARQLETTRDADVLVGAALEFLRQPYPLPMAPDPGERARTLVERAVMNAPESIDARALRQQLALRARLEREGAFDREFPLDQQLAALRQLPAQDRLELLPELVRHALSKLQAAERDGDPHLAGYGSLAAHHAGVWARELQDLAPRFPGHPRQGAAVYHASMALAAIALERDDRDEAAAQLLRAASAPACEELAYGPIDLDVLGALLDAGEREPVLAFLDRFGETSVAYRDALAAMAARIREGYRPGLELPRLPA